MGLIEPDFSRCLFWSKITFFYPIGSIEQIMEVKVKIVCTQKDILNQKYFAM